MCAGQLLQPEFGNRYDGPNIVKTWLKKIVEYNIFLC